MQKSHVPIPVSNEDPNQGPTVNNYFELWRFFEESGAKSKDHMIQLVTWLLAFAAVIIGFAAQQLDYSQSLCTKQPFSVLLSSLVGLFICALAVKLVVEFARHARSNFIKADYSAARIPRLDPIFLGRDVKIDANGTRWMSSNDLNENLSIQEVGRRYVLARVGRIFRNFIVISVLAGIILFILFSIGAATKLGWMISCPS